MSKYHRIVWNEGMFLGPQHFQQRDRYADGELRWVAEAQPFAWGLRRLQIEEEALINGRFALRALEAVLPDGSLLRAPEVDPLPDPRSFAEAFGAERPELPVFLALPAERPGLPLVSSPRSESRVASPFVAEERRLPDLNDPGQETELLIARRNLRLVFGGENTDGLVTLPLAVLERGEAGRPVIRADYAPPATSLEAAGPLLGYLRSIAEVLDAKSSQLAAQTRHRSAESVDFTSSDVGIFWLLHTVNSYLPRLLHFQRVPQSHPLALYDCLAGLAGGLCTFGVDRHPREVPAYQHEDLGGCFRGLSDLILDLLGKVMPTRFTGIVLKARDESLLIGEIKDDRHFADSCQWYLALIGELSEARLREDVPLQIIVGTPDNVDFLVQTATPGIRLEFVSQPPRDFPIKAGRSYFRLLTKGDIWETLRKAKSVAIYLGSPDLRAMSYELIVTK